MAEPAAQLVGRTVELEGLDRALDELRGGDFRALELVGEPGIGKTRLLEELGARADARGYLVLAGSASELEATLPFWLFVDALDEYVQALDAERLEALTPEDVAQLAPVLPAMRADRGPVEQGQYRLHGAVRRLLEVLAERTPLVLLLDDVHWADAGSIELLASLLRRPPRAAVLVALAVRLGQMPERLLSTLERAHRGGRLGRVELHALSAAEARELVGVAADAVYEQSGGNPFYLQQLARSRTSGGPRAIDDAVAGLEVPRGVAAALAEELALLPAPARRVLEGAAVAGDPFEPELAAAGADVSDGAVLEALDELLARDLVRQTPVPRRFRFRHPLVRRAVYEGSPGGWRLSAHERIARLLAERGAPVAALAHHVERSARHGDAAAAAILREAAREAFGRAPATAARLFGGALRLLGPGASERPDLLAELAAAHAAAGQFPDAYAVTLELIATAPATPPDLAARCAGLENLLGHHQKAHTRLVTALADLSDATSAEAVSLMLQLAGDGFYRMDYDGMLQWGQRAATAARARADRSLLASALGILTLAATCDGTVADAEAGRAEAAALVDAMPDEELAGCLDLAIDTLAGAELNLGRLDDAGEHVERALAIARATGQDHVVPVLFWVGTIRTARGDIPGAVEVLDTAVEVARVSGHAQGVAWNLFARSLAATAAGDVDTALAAAEESDETLRRLGDRSFPWIGAGIALAAARLEAGDPAGGADALVACAGDADFANLPAAWRPGAFELLTRCELARGRSDAAADAAERCRAAAVALGLPPARALADRAAAALALDRGDAARAAACASASASAARVLGAPVEAALGQQLAGRALARTGDRGAAVAELQRAAETFEACGATGRRDAVARELGRLGRRPRRARRGASYDGLASLTERELDVVRLVVDRRTNPEIAAALYLSPKTVETHIRHVFDKLGVSSRAEVARAVERANRAKR